ncbi:MAG: tyrosine-type recombinase/integrase [Saccharospirillaceae bacterium]|nr:tyrosine-type recombinase/integrase [Saccharospirillaceae bacterium]MCD8529973.1 tyrosine-type recombinase/integrase [Saccharospirillaceae bacterium]
MDSVIDYTGIRDKAKAAWQLTFDGLAVDQASAIQELVKWIVNGHSPFHPVLRGESYLPSGKSIKLLTNALIQYLARDRDKIIIWQTYLRLLIISGNRLGVWNLELPALVIVAKREKGRLNPERFIQRHYYHQWKEALFASFSHEAELSADARIGQILLAAILNGGLMSSSLLAALLKKASTQPNFHNQKIFFDLEPAWAGHEEVEHRRWFPDIVTEILISRFWCDISIINTDKISSSQIFQFIRQLFKEIGVAPKSRPSSIRALLESARVHLDTSIASFLSDYASRRYMSHSLRNSAWQRLSGEWLSHDDTEDSLDLAQWQTYPVMSESDDSDHEQSKEDLRDLRNCLSSDIINDACISMRTYREKFSDDDSSFLSCFSQWLLSLISSNGAKSVKISTARDYLSKIGNRLSEVLPDSDLRDISSEEYEECYSVLLDDVDSKGLRRKIAKVLYRFHQFLVDEYYVDKIDYHAVLGAFSAPAPVDANIVWVDEYVRAQRFLSDSNLIEMHPDMVDISQLILTLGYRCGLRRMEALKLRLIDLSGTYDPEMLLRPFKDRRLKTASSRRKIPLKALLNSAELEQLLSWRNRRLAQEADAPFSDYLFAIPEKRFTSISEDLVFPILHSALRAATGDKSVRYHHLRHSFGSLTLLKLMASDHGVPDGFFNSLPLQYDELIHASEFRKELLRIEGPTRKHLFAVAKLLGHSGPHVSLEHYIHILDVLLHHQISKTCVPEKSILVAASGVASATAYRWLNEGTEVFLRNVRKRYKCSVPARTSRVEIQHSPILINETLLDDDAVARSKMIWQCLYLHSAFSMSVDELAERFQLTASEVERLIFAGRDIAEERSKGPHAIYRFGMKEKLLPDGSKVRLLCPSKPRLEADKRLSDFILIGMARLQRVDPDLLHDGLKVFRKYSWRTRYQVVVKDAESAILYINFLYGIGLSAEQMRLTVLHGQKADESVVDSSLTFWKERINISAFRWGTAASTDGVSMGKQGWLAINVCSDSTSQASPALRYCSQLKLVEVGGLAS